VDQKTFRTIFDAHSRKVYTYTLWLVRNREACDDIVQAVFIKLWNKPKLDEEDRNIGLWLLMVARNECMDFFRKRSRFTRLRVDYSRETPMYCDSAVEKKFAWELLGNLNETDRTIVYLHIREGYTYKEIADSLATTENAVRVKACRALARLRKQMAEEEA
jgi:RNA polymerase sigma-70 factor (ECF subfamily)